ncbi:hypothetical protein BDZ45DRAFT_731374 [Acephala macrosclerotiorum]|nr:hypothetical protein BDZ45DRAFT_731374 [Acephala macrosclerotiorum]
MSTNEPNTIVNGSPHQTRLRACATCSRAKAKRVSGSDAAGKCQRCSRLNKPCEAPPSRARATPKRAPLQTSRVSKNQVAVLEEKLDGLVYLLKATRESGTAATVSSPQSRRPPSTTTPTQIADNDVTGPEAAVLNERLHHGGTLQQRFALPYVDPLPLQPSAMITKEYPLPSFNLGPGIQTYC